MRFLGVHRSANGVIFEAQYDTGTGPMVSSQRYWEYVKSLCHPDNELICLVRTDRLHAAEKPEVIVDGKWSDGQ